MVAEEADRARKQVDGEWIGCFRGKSSEKVESDRKGWDEGDLF
jgi:hypothetical protein